jgi:hypothetical protein
VPCTAAVPPRAPRPPGVGDAWVVRRSVAARSRPGPDRSMPPPRPAPSPDRPTRPARHPPRRAGAWRRPADPTATTTAASLLNPWRPGRLHLRSLTSPPPGPHGSTLRGRTAPPCGVARLHPAGSHGSTLRGRTAPPCGLAPPRGPRRRTPAAWLHPGSLVSEPPAASRLHRGRPVAPPSAAGRHARCGPGRASSLPSRPVRCRPARVPRPLSEVLCLSRPDKGGRPG